MILLRYLLYSMMFVVFASSTGSVIAESTSIRTYNGSADDDCAIERIITTFPLELDCDVAYAYRYACKHGYTTAMICLDGQPVGFINYSETDPDNIAELDSSHGLIHLIGVDPMSQGKGLGTLLIQYALAQLRQAGVSEVVLYVKSWNERARKIYVAHGFSQARIDVDDNCLLFRCQLL